MDKIALIATLAVLALAGALGCPGNTHCDYVAPTTPSGDPQRDIRGCWQSVGNGALGQDPYNLVAYQFTGIAESSPDGGVVVHQWREIQPPNNYYPGGMIFQNAYQIVGPTDDAGFTEIDLNAAPTYPPAAMRVTDTTLQLLLLPPGGSYLQPLRRAVCTGFGFDNPPEPCPNGLANP